MANSRIPYQDPATEDRSLASQTVARAGGIGGNVHREEVVISNGSADAALAEVLNAAPTTEYGLVVRNIPSGTQTVAGTVTATTGGLTDAQLRATAVPISVASLPLPTGAATAALQTQPGVDIGDVTINNAAGAAAVNIQDGGNSITIDGAVTVSGAVDTELPAAAALADNAANPTVPGVGAFGMAWDGVTWDRQTQPLTDTQLRATAVPVSGTVTATGPLTDAQLRATPVPVSGTVTANLAAGTNNIGDVDVLTLPALVAGTANIGDVDVLTVPAPLSTTGGGTEAAALRVTIANDSTGVLSIDDNGGIITVDGTVAVTNTGLTELAAAINASSQMDVNIAASTATLTVASHAVTNAGTFVVQENGAALTALQLIDNAISGAGFNITQQGGVAVSLNTGAVDTGTQRIVQANGAGKTILSIGGSAASSGNNTLVAAGTNRLKVKAFSLTTTSTTAMTCIFQSGAGGTELWRVIIQAPTGANAGANLSTPAPDWLFATASATLLNLNLSSANAVHWSVSYYDEA